MDMHQVVRRAETPQTSESLFEPCLRPRKIEVHEDARDVEVPAFAEKIGGDQ